MADFLCSDCGHPARKHGRGYSQCNEVGCLCHNSDGDVYRHHLTRLSHEYAELANKRVALKLSSERLAGELAEAREDGKRLDALNALCRTDLPPHQGAPRTTSWCLMSAKTDIRAAIDSAMQSTPTATPLTHSED